MKVNIPSPRLSRQIAKRLTIKVRSILKRRAKIIKKTAKNAITKQINPVHSKKSAKAIQ